MDQQLTMKWSISLSVTPGNIPFNQKANEGIVRISFLWFPVGAESYHLFLWHGMNVLCLYILEWAEHTNNLKMVLEPQSTRAG